MFQPFANFKVVLRLIDVQTAQGVPAISSLYSSVNTSFASTPSCYRCCQHSQGSVRNCVSRFLDQRQEFCNFLHLPSPSDPRSGFFVSWRVFTLIFAIYTTLPLSTIPFSRIFKVLIDFRPHLSTFSSNAA